MSLVIEHETMFYFIFQIITLLLLLLPPSFLLFILRPPSLFLKETHSSTNASSLCNEPFLNQPNSLSIEKDYICRKKRKWYMWCPFSGALQWIIILGFINFIPRWLQLWKPVGYGPKFLILFVQYHATMKSYTSKSSTTCLASFISLW